MLKSIVIFILFSFLCLSQIEFPGLRSAANPQLPYLPSDISPGIQVVGPADFQIAQKYSAVLTIDLNGQSTKVTSSFVLVKQQSCSFQKCYDGYGEYFQIDGERTEGLSQSQLKVKPGFTFSTNGPTNYEIRYSNDLDDTWKELIENFCQRFNPVSAQSTPSPPRTANIRSSANLFRTSSQEGNLQFTSTSSPYGNRIASSQVNAPIQNVQASKSQVSQEVILNGRDQIGKVSQTYVLSLDGNLQSKSQRTAAQSNDDVKLNLGINYVVTQSYGFSVRSSVIATAKSSAASNTKVVTQVQERFAGADKPEYLKQIRTTNTAESKRTVFQSQAQQVNSFPLNANILSSASNLQVNPAPVITPTPVIEPTLAFDPIPISSQALPTQTFPSVASEILPALPTSQQPQIPIPTLAFIPSSSPKTEHRTVLCEKSVHNRTIFGQLFQLNTSTQCNQSNYKAICIGKVKFYYANAVVQAQQFWFMQDILNGGNYTDTFTGTFGRYVWVQFPWPYNQYGLWLYLSFDYRLQVRLRTISRILTPPNSPAPFSISYIIDTMTEYSVSTYSVAQIRPLSNLKLRVTLEGSVSSGGISRSIEMIIDPPEFNTLKTTFANSAYLNDNTLTEYYAKRKRVLWIWWGWNDYYTNSKTTPKAFFALCVVPRTIVPYP